MAKGPKIKRELGPHFVHEKIIGDSRELLQSYYLVITEIYSVFCVCKIFKINFVFAK